LGDLKDFMSFFGDGALDCKKKKKFLFKNIAVIGHHLYHFQFWLQKDENSIITNVLEDNCGIAIR
jgi:hypothetical protein